MTTTEKSRLDIALRRSPRMTGRALRARLWTDEAQEHCLNGLGWRNGGCFALAEALARFTAPLSPTLMAVVSSASPFPRLAHHAVVRFTARGRAWLLDADGSSTAAELLHRWEVEEFLVRPRLITLSSATRDPDPEPADPQTIDRVIGCLARWHTPPPAARRCPFTGRYAPMPSRAGDR